MEVREGRDTENPPTEVGFAYAIHGGCESIRYPLHPLPSSSCDEAQVGTGSFPKTGRSMLLAEKPRAYQAELCSPVMTAMSWSFFLGDGSSNVTNLNRMRAPAGTGTMSKLLLSLLTPPILI